MILVQLKPLIEKLNTYSRQALENAAGFCLSQTNYEITVEHLLSKLLDDIQSDLPLLLRQEGMDAAFIKRAIDGAIELMPSGNNGKPAFSPLLLELLQDSWLISSMDLYERRVRSGAIFLALLSRVNFFASGSYGDHFRNVNRQNVLENFSKTTANSIEKSSSEEGSGEFVGGSESSSAGGAIDKYCEDFTAKAKDGKIDPVFGRDNEIRQMIDILARRRKNNPICVGDPGVGKTAVVEGLALRVVQGDVPKSLQGVRIIGLDMGLLQAGASVKGEFEKRLNGVIEEVKGSVKPTILFIDEAHTLIGAGGAAGGSDAANLLKPALARGELKTIAATTWAEYKKYFEKDAALARRFQLVQLDEPSLETAAMILRGLKPRYEEVHKVIVRDDALTAAAELSDRYITGRKLPDKAVDLLDTACARINVMLSAKPASLEFLERKAQASERQKVGLLRDKTNLLEIDEERLKLIELELPKLYSDAEKLKTDWLAEKEAANQAIEARTKLYEAVESKLADEVLSSLRQAVVDTDKHLKALQSKNGGALIRIEVDPDVVAQVVSDWTGIPLGKVLRDQASNVMHLKTQLESRVVGQDFALHQIAQSIQTAKSGLKDPQQPMGIFLLVGPSGVGKTETALAVADILFGDEKSTITINMSEYQEKHNVSKLVGSPPGYVGYGEGGILSEAVRKRPYSAVLLDEVEKANLDVMNVFYQVFDKGILTDGEGEEINFSNTVIFLTSNLGSDIVAELSKDGARPDGSLILEAIRPVLSQHFKPALLARMTILPYATLAPEALSGIVRLKLNKVARRLQHNNRIEMKYSDAVVDLIVARCTEVETGARNIDHILTATLLPKMSQELLAKMAGGSVGSTVSIDIGKENDFAITFQD
jgi:type VI secretion system protein VasG